MTPICTIDATGIHAPAFPDILTWLQNQYFAIYGTDVYLGSDSQDGQLLTLFANAIFDTNSQVVAVYNAFSPTTAQGAGLSSVVKINGLGRLISTYSTAGVTIVGVAGTTITNGFAYDDLTQRWNLPASVVIPSSGQISVTATSDVAGVIAATPNSITLVGSPTAGWQKITNPLASVAGAPIETDAVLRQRQAISTALPALTALDGIIGAVASVTGVTRYAAYENDTNLTDSNGVPPHSLAFVVEGGDSTTIAQEIALRKTPGAGTYGTGLGIVAIPVTDAYGLTRTITFMRPFAVTIIVSIAVTTLLGYTTTVHNEIISAITSYISSIPIGQSVILSKLYVPANLTGADSKTFNIESLKIARNGALPSASDAQILFNEVATCVAANVSLAEG